MSISLSRMMRLIIGVLAVLLGLLLMVQTAPAASAATVTQHVKQATVASYDGCKGTDGVYFVITDLATGAPSSITVTLSDGSTSSTATVLLLKNPGNSAHYSYAFPSAGLFVTDATADLPDTWSGQFNISHCLGDTSTTTTTTQTVPTTVSTVVTVPTTVTKTATATKTETTTATKTETTTVSGNTTVTKTVTENTTVPVTTTLTVPGSTVTQTETQTETQTLGGTTVTVPTTLTITVAGVEQTVPTTVTITLPAANVEVSGVSSEVAPQQTSPSVEVLGVSGSVPEAAPSANAHTGQGLGWFPWLLLAGGLVLIASSWGVRRGLHRR